MILWWAFRIQSFPYTKSYWMISEDLYYSCLDSFCWGFSNLTASMEKSDVNILLNISVSVPQSERKCIIFHSVKLRNLLRVNKMIYEAILQICHNFPKTCQSYLNITMQSSLYLPLRLTCSNLLRMKTRRWFSKMLKLTSLFWKQVRGVIQLPLSKRKRPSTRR